MSKLNQAIELVRNNPGVEKKVIIQKMVADLKFSKAMAHNYYGKAIERAGSEPTEKVQAPAQKVERRIASSANKALHNILDIALMEFSDADIPAFLKK